MSIATMQPKGFAGPRTLGSFNLPNLEVGVHTVDFLKTLHYPALNELECIGGPVAGFDKKFLDKLGNSLIGSCL